jgi:hypothetical protein
MWDGLQIIKAGIDAESNFRFRCYRTPKEAGFCEKGAIIDGESFMAEMDAELVALDDVKS